MAQNQFEFKFPIDKKLKNGDRVFTVSEVNSLIKVILLNHFPSHLAIAGEITDFRCYQNGHCYFSLKDAMSQLPCVMWASNYRKLKFKLKNGMAVIAQGNIDVYEQSGKYQFYAEAMEPEGVGALRLAFEQMVQRLQAAGLFEQTHKKPLPAYPFRIGIVTSEAGAALHDISSSIFKRWPPAKLFLYAVPVQGEGAADSIASAVRDINRKNKKWQLDLLIIGRGGGSLEDLWAFNEEVVARAIYDSKIPIISAVGHEIDTSISDLVADARAATPTKAAEIAVPDINEVAGRLDTTQKRLRADLESNFNYSRQNLRTVLASSVFRNPLSLLTGRIQQLDETADSLSNTIKKVLSNISSRLQFCFEKIVQIEPHRLLGRKMLIVNEFQNRCDDALRANVARNLSTLNNVQTRLQNLMHQKLTKAELIITANENRLAGLSPRSVLSRGYSITTNKRTGSLVHQLKDLEINDVISTELADGNFIESSVTSKQNVLKQESKNGRKPKEK